MRRALWWVVAVISGATQAQPFADDFEADLSAWTPSLVAGQSLVLSPSAAHRGDAGLRLTDGETVGSGQPGAFLKRVVTSSGAGLFSRVWLRRTSYLGPGNGIVFAALWGEGLSAHTFQVANEALICSSQPLQSDAGASNLSDSCVPGFDGGWHLLEGATVGRGSPDAAMWFAVDGREVFRHEHQQGFAPTWDGVALGQVYASGPMLQCTIDYDDVRFDLGPMASTLDLSVTPTTTADVCTPLTVGLRSTWPQADGGYAALAPYSVDVSVSGAAIFTDSQCSASGGVAIASGTIGRQVYFRVNAPGRITLVASSIDFIGALATVTIQPVDAGSGGGSAGGFAGGTAGGSAAGGSVAGGSVAGGSVAGGSVAGGSVAGGGSVSGGSAAGGTSEGGGGATSGGTAGGVGNRLDSYYSRGCSEAAVLPIGLLALVLLRRGVRRR